MVPFCMSINLSTNPVSVIRPVRQAVSQSARPIIAHLMASWKVNHKLLCGYPLALQSIFRGDWTDRGVPGTAADTGLCREGESHSVNSSDSRSPCSVEVWVHPVPQTVRRAKKNTPKGAKNTAFTISLQSRSQAGVCLA